MKQKIREYVSILIFVLCAAFMAGTDMVMSFLGGLFFVVGIVTTLQEFSIGSYVLTLFFGIAFISHVIGLLKETKRRFIQSNKITILRNFFWVGFSVVIFSRDYTGESARYQFASVMFAAFLIFANLPSLLFQLALFDKKFKQSVERSYEDFIQRTEKKDNGV